MSQRELYIYMITNKIYLPTYMVEKKEKVEKELKIE